MLLAVIELRKHGARAPALTKKRRHWPKHIKGDEIRNHFEDKNPGDCDCLPGELKGVKFNIICMKEPDHTMMLMTSYGTVICPDDAEEKKELHVEFFISSSIQNALEITTNAEMQLTMTITSG